MLDLFRKRGLSSIVYGVVIVATILVFVIQFRPNAGQKSASINQTCPATVKGQCISPKDHQSSFRLLIPRDQQGALLTQRAKAMGLKRIALDGLIERELLVSEAERIGLVASEEEVTDELYNGYVHVSVPSDNPSLAYSLRVGDGKIYVGFRDQKSKAFDMKVYKRTVLNLTGRSEIEFHEEQARELLAAKMRDLVRAPVRVSEVEALESYVGEKSSSTLGYIQVKQAYVAKYGLTVTDADVEKWAADKDNKKAVDEALALRKADSLPKAGHIRHILIKFEPGATPESKKLALQKMAEAVARVKHGEAFADVARDVSGDPGSAPRGGDVGDKTDGFVLPFKKAADALKPGEMTPAAVETQFGYHIIMRDDPAKTAEVEAALKKDVARDLFTKSKAVELTKEVAAKINASLKDGKSADDAIKSGTSTLTRAQPTVAPLAVADEAPAPAAGGDAGAAPAAPKADGGATKPEPPKELTAQTDPDRPQLLSSNAFNKGGDPIPSLSGEATTKVMSFAFEAKPGETMIEPLRTDDGFFVVQLKERKAATRDEFDKDRETYIQTLLAAKQAEALAVYVKRLREAAKAEIKIDESFLADPGAKDGGAPAQPDFEEEEP
jgi:peptidyl-prolyl cis-trans isomerase D